MRLTEFASAEDTLKLWKMISDNTWAAIEQQAEAEKRVNAERAAARKFSSKRGTGKSTAKPMPPKRLPPPLQHVSAPVAKDAKPATFPAKASYSEPTAQQNPNYPAAKPAPATALTPQNNSDRFAGNILPSTLAKVQQHALTTMKE